MSARQPFVPSRPASRAAHDAEAKNGLTKPLPLRPSQSSSGSGPPTTAQQEPTANVTTDQYGLQATVAAPDGSNVSALLTSLNKPLNIAGLIQKKPNRSANLSAQVPPSWGSRKSSSASDEAQRSSARSINNQKDSSIQFSSAFGRPVSPFPAASFRPPPLPPSRLGTMIESDSGMDGPATSQSFTPGEAHILDRAGASRQSEEVGQAHARFDTDGRSHTPFSPMGTLLPPDSSMLSAVSQRTKPSATPLLERIQETIESQPPQQNPAGPSVDQDDVSVSFNQLRRAPKRGRGEDPSDEDYGSEVEMKRWRVHPNPGVDRDTNRGDSNAPGSGRCTPALQRGYQASAASASVIDVDAGDNALQTNRGYITTMDPNPSRQIVEPSGGVILRQLFDFDSGLSMEEHLQVYEDAKHRWTHCSLEEWQAGAEGVWMESSFFLLGADLSVTLELMGKFGDVMDYVKDHLHTKMSLYASLHSRVEEHKGTLGNRDKILQDVRERLVRQSGNVLGSGIAS